MQRNINKATSLLMAILTVICLCTSAFAEDDERQCGDWAYTVTFDNTAKIVKYSGNNEVVTIPHELDGYPVSTLGEYCFGQLFVDNNYNKIIIPEGVTDIDGCAFIYCTSLKEIVLPRSLVYIGRSAFPSCLSEISIAEDNPYYSMVDGVLFEIGTRMLKFYPANREAIEYEIPFGTKGIANCAFLDNVFLQRVTAPDGLEVINASAFNSCEKLEEVILPESVDTIDRLAFSNCKQLKHVVIPGFPFMGNDVFIHSDNVTVAIVKDSIEENYCIENKIQFAYIEEEQNTINNSDKHSDFKTEEEIDYIFATKTLNQICGICGEIVDSTETTLDTLINGKTFIPSPEELCGHFAFVNLTQALTYDGVDLFTFEDFEGKYLASDAVHDGTSIGFVQYIGQDGNALPYESREERNSVTELNVIISSKLGVSLLIDIIAGCDPSLGMDEVMNIASTLMDKGVYSHNRLNYELDRDIIPLLTITISK